MRAAILRNNRLVVDDIPVPVPGPGEVLVKTLACGICGTDLHAVQFAETLVRGSRCSGGFFAIDPNRDIVMGHEFCGEVVDYGPGVRKRFKVGARVCSMPVLKRSSGDEGIGYSSEVSGGFGEMMRLTEFLLLEVPNGVSAEAAALTEPMAVGCHAVAKARLERRDVSLVLGCGPVGLSVIAALKMKGAAKIVATDLSQCRRDLALAIGADKVIDPRERPPYEVFESGGSAGSRKVIFECVGAPGMLEDIMVNAPRGTTIVVAGVCMRRDNIYPAFGVYKELDLQFVSGYTGEEFATALRNIGKGKLPVQPFITGKVGVDGVPQAFAELMSPERHVKILVEPWRA